MANEPAQYAEFPIPVEFPTHTQTLDLSAEDVAALVNEGVLPVEDVEAVFSNALDILAQPGNADTHYIVIRVSR